jgi:acyl carrier protein
VPDPELTLAATVAAVEKALCSTRKREVAVQPQTRFEALAVESMEMLEILIALEEMTGCVIPDEELARIETVADLASARCI